MSNMFPTNGSVLGPGARGAGRPLESTQPQLVSQAMAPERNASQVTDDNIPHLYEQSKESWVGGLETAWSFNYGSIIGTA